MEEQDQHTGRPRLRLEHVVWAVFIYCGLVTAMWPRRTYDIWWHLATGRLIVDTRTIPDSDPFTWTRHGQPWITHEWGWEVPMYLLYARWGHGGLMILRTAVAVGACALLAWLCLRRGAGPLATMAVGALAIFAARPLFNDRPQVATILFFVAMLCLIEMAERGRERWLLATPLLMIPWVNVHGGFIFGPALLGLYGACCFVRWVGQYRADQPLRPAPAILAGAVVLTLAGCLVNPNGVAGATYPLDYIYGPHAWHKTWITEYESPDFSNPIFLYLGLLIVATATIFAVSQRRARLWDVVLTAAFLFMTLKWQRNVALFAFAVAPALAMHLSHVLDDLGLARPGRDPARREPSVLFAAIIAVLAVLASTAAPSALRRASDAFSTDMPVQCVHYLERTGIDGRMFNTYRWGGYLIWHLWPQQRVFIDGRADVAGRPLVEDWQKLHKLQDGWEEVLERYQIDWAVLSVRSPLCRALDLDPNWRRAFEEPTGRVYVRRGSVADRSAAED